MKQYSYPLDARSVEEFFSPIRDKRSLLDLLIRSVKYMLVSPEVSGEDVHGEIKLHIDKMSRIFFFSEDKYFSLNFPFQVIENDQELNFYSKYLEALDNKITSELLSIIRSDKIHDSTCILEFSDEFIDVVEYNEELWMQYNHLLVYEDGYVRFDHDPENTNGTIHPTNHLDIFYSNSARLKLGVNEKLSNSNLIDILDTTTNCTFLSEN